MRVCLTLLNLVYVLSGTPLPATASDRAEEEDRKWLPSLAVLMTLAGQGTDSSSQSNLRPTDNPGILLQESQAVLFPSIGGSFELMSPVVLSAGGKPRVFAHVDLLPILTTDRKLAFEGAPGPFSFPDVEFFPEEAIEGQGSRTSLDVSSLAYGAGAGIAFSFDLMGYDFRIKPSIEYYRYSGTFRGIVSRAFKTANNTPVERLVQLTLTERRTWDNLGGGVEFEVTVLKSRRFEGVAFVTARGFAPLGDRSISGRVTNPATPVDDEALFRYKASPYLYNFGFGFRARWTGF